MNIYRKIYTKINGTIPKGYDIHHIDGDHTNNDPANLKAVSLQEHYDIHFSQGDYAAAHRIIQRMNVTPKEKSRVASLAATKANAEGKCGFKLGHASEAGKIGGKKGGVLAKQNRTGIFALTSEQIKEKNTKAAITKMINSGRASAWPKKEL